MRHEVARDAVVGIVKKDFHGSAVSLVTETLSRTCPLARESRGQDTIAPHKDSRFGRRAHPNSSFCAEHRDSKAKIGTQPGCLRQSHWRRSARPPRWRGKSARWPRPRTSASLPARNVQLERDALAAAAVRLENARRRLAAAGLTPRRPVDEPLDILLTPTIVSMRALTGGRSGLQTRGLTLRGIDRNLVLLAWHAPGDPLDTLTHEYAHQLDDSAWPLWFVEGRAEFLARYPSRAARGHLARLERSAWLGLPALLAAEAVDASAPPGAFYAKAWLVFAWLAERSGDIAGIRPAASCTTPIDELGAGRRRNGIAAVCRASRRGIAGGAAGCRDTGVRRKGSRPGALGAYPAGSGDRHRFAAPATGGGLACGIAPEHPQVARIHAARGLAAIAAKDYDQAESSFARAIALGDRRAATAYRYTLLLMRPGDDAGQRAADALEHSLRARDRLPGEPRYQLAVAQARNACRRLGPRIRRAQSLGGIPRLGAAGPRARPPRCAGAATGCWPRKRRRGSRPKPPLRSSIGCKLPPPSRCPPRRPSRDNPPAARVGPRRARRSLTAASVGSIAPAANARSSSARRG